MNLARAKNQAKQVLFELGVEVKVTLDQLQAQVVSREFEDHLDRLIDRAGERKKFERLMHRRPVGASSITLIRTNGSVDPEPIDSDDIFECDLPAPYALAHRRARIRMKIAFLSRIAKERVEEKIHHPKQKQKSA